MAAATPAPCDLDAVEQRLRFATKRAQDLFTLNGGDLLHAEADPRQQNIQEFFFHLLGAVDFFAQYVDQERAVGMGPDVTTIGKLVGKIGGPQIPVSDPLGPALRALYVNPAKTTLPADPYSDDGYLYRAYNYRHHTTHRRTNPWLLRQWAEPSVSLLLDPRLPAGQGPNHSMKPYDEELNAMLRVVQARINQAKALI
jgi:hypothetical protein